MSEDRQKAASFPAVSGFGKCDAGGARETSDRAPSRETLRILIADDQDLVRSGFRMILNSYDGLSVEGEARNGEEAVYLAQKIRPDVVLMDIRMPVRNGIDATRDITSNLLLSGTHVLVLTTFDIDEYVYDALAAGASGFLLKDAEPDDIVEAIHIVARGDALIQPSVMRRLVETFVASRPRAGMSKGSRARETIRSLTDREREILMLIARGLTNEEIAGELIISPATVKTHVARIMGKLDAHDRAQLVVCAYESGLVSPRAN